jgi:RNA polymerase sigma-70 factor (ECF subfamily)
MPEEPEALGLVSLMLFAEARRVARRDPDGGYVPLAEQDVAKWNQDLIGEAEELLLKSSVMQRPGRYQVEAAIQSAHVVRRSTGQADWKAIVDLYGILASMIPSPVVAVNSAVALAQAGDADGALAVLDELGDDSRLADYQPYWAARAEILVRVGKKIEAAAAYDRAIGLEHDPSVRAFLQGKRMAMKQ